LIGNGVALALQVIVTTEALVKGCNFPVLFHGLRLLSLEKNKL
jgi:hypothetical protein